MIKNRKEWAEWENRYLRQKPVDYRRNLQVYEALYRQACLLGALPPENPLAGLEEKIRLAKAVNVSGDPGKDRA